ncbi:MAG TPA: hypothetical protein VG035_01020, partial [Actinomycetota bacterium]|nr:hypothetical protein [Actinomycetota bacterium]
VLAPPAGRPDRGRPAGPRAGPGRRRRPGAAHALLSVELPGGASALVPAVAALVTVELDAGRVLVDAVPGLLPEE